MVRWLLAGALILHQSTAFADAGDVSATVRVVGDSRATAGAGAAGALVGINCDLATVDGALGHLRDGATWSASERLELCPWDVGLLDVRITQERGVGILPGMSDRYLVTAGTPYTHSGWGVELGLFDLLDLFTPRVLDPATLHVPGMEPARDPADLAAVDGASAPRWVDVDAAHAVTDSDADPGGGRAVAMFQHASAPDRYQAGALLGLGGMGEVVARADRATGRTVAVKRVRADLTDPSLLRRFAREARIQAQLEHPSIVPVYDLEIDPDGAQYFTMKKIRGESLGLVLDRLRTRDPEATAHYTRRRLLSVLSTVALTLEYAHRRSVIHRDLKPTNVMLGDLGEAYVLDWGLADVIESRPPSPGDERPTDPSLTPPLAAALDPSLTSAPDLGVTAGAQLETGAGMMLGTPGYAAPEMLDRERRVAGPHLLLRTELPADGEPHQPAYAECDGRRRAG